MLGLTLLEMGVLTLLLPILTKVELLERSVN